MILFHSSMQGIFSIKFHHICMFVHVNFHVQMIWELVCLIIWLKALSKAKSQASGRVHEDLS